MEILFSDDRVTVCVKPAGVLSTDEPGGMPQLLRAALNDPDAVVKSVHRLDRAVGGVMVYARTRRAASDLGRQIEDGTFQKTYLAVVSGTPAEPGAVLRHWLLRDRGARRTLVVGEGTDGAQEAILSYELMEASGGLSLLSVRLYTGRTHQIRCQLSHVGHPILGDGKYGGAPVGSGIALWSNGLRFLHPRTGEEMSFLAFPPATEPWSRFRFPGQDRENDVSRGTREIHE